MTRALDCDDRRHGRARFCPGCGTWRGHPADDARPRSRHHRAVIGACCLGVALLAVTALQLPGTLADGGAAATDAADMAGDAPGVPSAVAPSGDDADEVALPETVTRPGDTPAADTSTAAPPGPGTATDRAERQHVRDVGAESMGVAACMPRGCVRWERHVDGLLAADTGAVHLVDARQVRSFDAGDGTLRWRRSLLDPLPPDAAPDGFAAHPPPVAIDARSGLVVTASARRVVLLDGDGHRRWTTAPAADATLELARLVENGHVLTAVRPAGDAPVPLRVTALDAATGSERWGQPVNAVLEVDDDVVTVLDADGGLAGLATADGRVRWRRTATSDPSFWPSLLTGRDMAMQPPTGSRNTTDRTGDRTAGHAGRAVERPRDGGRDHSDFDAVIVAFPGGSATIRGIRPEVLLREPAVVVVDDRLLGLGRGD